MKDLQLLNNPFNDDKVIANCSIFGMMDTSGTLFSGKPVIEAIANMHDRGNGLGGGFAVYGLYPDKADLWAFHVMYTSQATREITESYIKQHFMLAADEELPNRPAKGISDPPIVWRYWGELIAENTGESDADQIVRHTMTINRTIDGAFVFSCGKDMGVFKGVGFPEEVADFFILEEAKGYLWTAHGRFPTNTQAWWGGAHPFNILDWTVVHNGEISSYGINKRFLEMYGYHCTMLTDTEVLAYAADLLMRKHELPVELFAKIIAPPLWEEIDRMSEKERALLMALRQTYSGLLMNGPFTIIVAHGGEMIGVTDRIRLRPLTAATSGTRLFLSSEEAAIRLIQPELDSIWTPRGGEPVVAKLGRPVPSNSAAAKQKAVIRDAVAVS